MTQAVCYTTSSLSHGVHSLGSIANLGRDTFAIQVFHLAPLSKSALDAPPMLIINAIKPYEYGVEIQPDLCIT